MLQVAIQNRKFKIRNIELKSFFKGFLGHNSRSYIMTTSGAVALIEQLLCSGRSHSFDLHSEYLRFCMLLKETIIDFWRAWTG